MQLSLDADVQKLIMDRVRSGRFATPEQVVAAALVNMQQQEQFGDFAPGELAELLAEGERAIDRDGTLDGDAAYEARRARRASRSGPDAKP